MVPLNEKLGSSALVHSTVVNSGSAFGGKGHWICALPDRVGSIHTDWPMSKITSCPSVGGVTGV